ncbi:MAG: sporulation initiation factor Spo0A C-terminal domain-containing protein [Roseburia sp.]|nr:sporulation initiation factor Spo0A C-terminal domain-containing protein [Roseburia sp.]
MRDEVKKLLKEAGIRGGGTEYIADAVILYKDGMTLKDIYAAIAKNRGVRTAAVEKSVARAVGETVSDAPCTPKAFIARIKERIMFELGE